MKKKYLTLARFRRIIIIQLKHLDDFIVIVFIYIYNTINNICTLLVNDCLYVSQWRCQFGENNILFN